MAPVPAWFFDVEHDPQVRRVDPVQEDQVGVVVVAVLIAEE